MKLLTFHGSTASEVTSNIRNVLGPDAILVAERKDERTGGVEILAASAPESETDRGRLDPEIRDRLLNWAESFAPPVSETISPTFRSAAGMQEATAASTFLDAGFSADFAASLAKILPLAAPQSLFDQSQSGPVDSLPSYSLDCLSHAFSDLAEFAPLGNIPEQPIFVAGPAGSGKSLTIVKLAARALSAGALPRIVIADPLNLGPGRPLTMFAGIAPVDIEIISSPDELKALLNTPTSSPVFIDSWGVNPLDRGEISALSALTSTTRSCNAMNIGVIPAGISNLDAEDATRMFSLLGFRHSIMTRCDTSRAPGATIEALVSAGIRFSELGISSRPTPGLAIASPVELARLFPELCDAPQATRPEVHAA